MSSDGAKAGNTEATRSLRQAIAGRSGEGTRTVPELVGCSAAMVRILRLASEVAPTNSTVLITGEIGVGKEVVARNVHNWSHRRDDAFFAVNCGAIPETLLENQLFGHAKGAFAGAESANEGLFYRARGGTTFLDDIGELPPRLQVMLLRMIEDKKILPLGTVNPIEVDVRIIVASNRDLRSDVDAGRFREDLFHRINDIRMEIPPLRERREDIPRLVEHLVARHNARQRRNYRGVDDDTLKLLLELPLRGNVRELHHLIEYAMIVGDGAWVRPGDLPQGVARGEERPTWGDDYASAMQRFAKTHGEDGG